MSFQGNRLLAKVVKAQSNYHGTVEELKKYLKDKVEFEFAIDWQPSDGHMITDVDDYTHTAPLVECLSVIYMKGSLSKQDHLKLCI